MKVLISGASGGIGSEVAAALLRAGHEVTRLVRRPPQSGEIHWDPAQPIRSQSVEGFDAVIHLAGETIAERWNAEKKRRIRDSRVNGTRHLSEALAQASRKPKVLLVASAIGFYGNRGDEVLIESSASGTDFLAGVCREWEGASQPAERAGLRVVRLRFGVVLSAKFGALQKMLPPFRIGLGGKIGSGRQFMSWVSIADVVSVTMYALNTGTVSGPVNVVSPNAVTNGEFTKQLAKALSRPAIFPMPAFAARAVFGEMADALLLASQRVEPAKLMASGYKFKHQELSEALKAVLAAK